MRLPLLPLSCVELSTFPTPSSALLLRHVGDDCCNEVYVLLTGLSHSSFRFAAQVASSVGVTQFVVPGSTVVDSRGALELARRQPNVSVVNSRIQNPLFAQRRICS